MRVIQGARAGLAMLGVVLLMPGCGGHHSTHSAASSSERPTLTASRASATIARVPTPATGDPRPNPRDWTRFDYDAQRSGVGPDHTGITRASAGRLTARVVHIDGTVDASPIELHAIEVRGRRRDVVVVTTSYGHTIAIDPLSGHALWEYKAPGARRLEGSAQVTTATPVSDPDRRYVYAASPDGLIHKLALATGREVRSDDWPTRVTLDPREEKIGGALNLSGSLVIAVVGGYIENHPEAQHYQGHVVTIDRVSGRIAHVFNTLCSNRPVLMVPRTCDANDAAVWARSGAVVEPGSGRLLFGTGNGHFNGSTRWGDSVLELSPDGSRLLHNWTPPNQALLDRDDFDIGSTAPALLPVVSGRHLAIQGGKYGRLNLLDLDRLDGSTQAAGPRTGGELQTLRTLGGGMMFTAPAVWRHAGQTHVFIGDIDGIAGYTVSAGRRPSLTQRWSSPDASTSPVVAGGLLYAFDLRHKALDIRLPTSGQLIRSLPAAVGHWASPIVISGRIVLPVGDYQLHEKRGVIFIYHLPGR